MFLTIAGILFCLYCTTLTELSILSSIHLLYMKILSFFLLSGSDNIFNILITFFCHQNTSTDWQTFLFWKILLAITFGRWYDKNNDIEAITTWSTWLNFCVSQSAPWWLSPFLSWQQEFCCWCFLVFGYLLLIGTMHRTSSCSALINNIINAHLWGLPGCCFFPTDSYQLLIFPVLNALYMPGRIIGTE